MGTQVRFTLQKLIHLQKLDKYMTGFGYEWFSFLNELFLLDLGS